VSKRISEFLFTSFDRQAIVINTHQLLPCVISFQAFLNFLGLSSGLLILKLFLKNNISMYYTYLALPYREFSVIPLDRSVCENYSFLRAVGIVGKHEYTVRKEIPGFSTYVRKLTAGF
jgi:hypothetical protein